MIFRKLLSKTS